MRWAALFLLLTSCHQHASPPDFKMNPRAWAYTHWDCRYATPSVWIHDRTLDLSPGFLKAVRAHESDHVNSMIRRGCMQHAAWIYASVHNAIEFEASAFCAMAKALHAHGEEPTLKAAVDHVATYLAGGYNFPISHRIAVIYIREQGCRT